MSAPPGRLVLLGHPVAHSLSPTFQNAALRRAGIAVRYEAMDVAPAELARAAARLRAEGWSGNVTVPHKEAFAALCDRRTPIADRVGAVNTFWVDDGMLVGDNTDVGGFEQAVDAAFGAARSWPRVALLGAGGASAAIAAAAERWTGSAVAVWSRNAARAARLADRFGCVKRAESIEDALAGASLVVHATPLGLHEGDAYPVPVAALPSRACVFDLVYARGGTRWVRAARAAGHPADDGLGMLIAQGALAFERWFGMVPDREVMWASVNG